MMAVLQHSHDNGPCDYDFDRVAQKDVAIQKLVLIQNDEIADELISAQELVQIAV